MSKVSDENKHALLIPEIPRRYVTFSKTQLTSWGVLAAASPSTTVRGTSSKRRRPSSCPSGAACYPSRFLRTKRKGPFLRRQQKLSPLPFPPSSLHFSLLLCFLRPGKTACPTAAKSKRLGKGESKGNKKRGRGEGNERGREGEDGGKREGGEGLLGN